MPDRDQPRCGHGFERFPPVETIPNMREIPCGDAFSCVPHVDAQHLSSAPNAGFFLGRDRHGDNSPRFRVAHAILQKIT